MKDWDLKSKVLADDSKNPDRTCISIQGIDTSNSSDHTVYSSNIDIYKVEVVYPDFHYIIYCLSTRTDP